MAKKSVIAREKKRERLVKLYAGKRLKLKEIISSPKFSEEEKWQAQMKLQKMPRNSSKSRLTARCSITGRPRGVFKKFGLSRTQIREFATRGEISGLKKASW